MELESTIRKAGPVTVGLDTTLSISTASLEQQSNETATHGAQTSENGKRNGDWKARIETSELPVLGEEKVAPTADDDWERDPNHPRNWSKAHKWIAVTVVGLYNFMAPLPSAMMAPALPDVAHQYQIMNQTVLALTLSIFLISYALGPLLLSPLSEMYGRTWILHIGNLFNIAFNIGCAFSPNTACLLAMRFMTGFSSSAPVAIGGGSISDLFAEKERGSAMALFTLGPLLSPAIGPIIGGYITQVLGVKWLFIIIGLICSLASIVGLPLLRETYAPVVRWKLAKKSGDLEMAKELNPSVIAARGGTKSQILWVNLSRPLVLLTRSFVCFVLSLYQAFNYGIYYLMVATFAKFFKETYDFGPGIGGLTYLGLGIGFFISTFACVWYSDKLYMKLAEKNGGKGTPEMRMPSLMIGSIICPIGLLWYGWSAQAQLHYMMPIIGTAIYGFGLMAAYLPIQLYLIDAFVYAASATGAASVFRPLLGFAFPLFGQQMSDKLGYGGANTLLAGIAILIGVPFPIWIYYKGAEIRARSPLTR